MSNAARIARLKKKVMTDDPAPTRRVASALPWADLTPAELRWIGKKIELFLLDAEKMELRSMTDAEIDARIATLNSQLAEVDAAKGLPRGTSLEARDLHLAKTILAEAGMS